MEFIFVSLLFIIYIILWELKRRQLIKSSGNDPDVLSKSTSPIQKFFSVMTNILTIYIVLLIILHGIGLQWYSLFTRFPVLEQIVYDIVGFALGLVGLSICFMAQRTMKDSWRVGIDEHSKPDLIKTGMYAYIRNPTYVGMYIMNIGVWLTWPTWTIALFVIIFYIIMEMQVRCEEDFLEKTYGDEYRNYYHTTKRYIPKIY